MPVAAAAGDMETANVHQPSVRASHTFLFVRATNAICLFLNRDVIQSKPDEPGKAPGNRRETITTMTRKRSGILGLLFLVVVGLAATGLFVAQQRYIRHHLPLIRAQLTNAEAEGPKMLERIGEPAGSIVISAVNRAIYSSSRQGMWSDTPCAVKWTSTWDVIGTENETLDWYR